jgi:uncharacterized protein with HEPN domain
MAVRTPRVPLTDMRDAIRRIEHYTRDQTAISFAKNELVRDAVERCIEIISEAIRLEIISEASRRVPADLKSLHPEIPWSKVAAIGNIFRHDYDEVYSPLVWEIVTEHLPALRRAINDLLRRTSRKRRASRT